MAFPLTSKDYVAVLTLAYQKIHNNLAYVTSLDSAIADGDHGINMDMGFSGIVQKASELEVLPIDEMLKNVGITLMSIIGGSSGALYGNAYITAANAMRGKTAISAADLCTILASMLDGMMEIGGGKPGMKTMLDSLYPAVSAYREALREGREEKETLELVKEAAIKGMEATKDMPCSRGRASYLENKGIGFMDPGAVTMTYQIEVLVDYILS